VRLLLRLLRLLLLLLLLGYCCWASAVGQHSARKHTGHQICSNFPNKVATGVHGYIYLSLPWQANVRVDSTIVTDMVVPKRVAIACGDTRDKTASDVTDTAHAPTGTAGEIHTQQKLPSVST
jgi:hypothetical protein